MLPEKGDRRHSARGDKIADVLGLGASLPPNNRRPIHYFDGAATFTGVRRDASARLGEPRRTCDRLFPICRGDNRLARVGAPRAGTRGLLADGGCSGTPRADRLRRLSSDLPGGPLPC